MNNSIHILYITFHQTFHSWNNKNYGSKYNQNVIINSIHNTSNTNIFLNKEYEDTNN